MAEPKMYRVKNISSETLLEPWTKVELAPGQISDPLEPSIAQRIISVFPYRSQLLDVNSKSFTASHQVKKKPVAIQPEKKTDEPVKVPSAYRIKNTSTEDITVSEDLTIKAGETSDLLDQKTAQMVNSKWNNKTQVIPEYDEEKPKE